MKKEVLSFKLKAVYANQIITSECAEKRQSAEERRRGVAAAGVGIFPTFHHNIPGCACHRSRRDASVHREGKLHTG